MWRATAQPAQSSPASPVPPRGPAFRDARRDWRAPGGVRSWLLVLSPIVVAAVALVFMARLSASGQDLLAYGEVTGRLSASGADLGSQLEAVAAGRPLAQSPLTGDIERFEHALTDVGALQLQPAWRSRHPGQAGSRHLERLQAEWVRAREALLDAMDAAPGSRELAAARARAIPVAGPFGEAAQRLSDDLEDFDRSEHRAQAARVSWLFGLLAASLVVGALLRALDLRSLRRHQAELERLSLVAESTGSSVVLLDGQGRARWANDAFLRTTGWEDVAGRSILELLCRDPGELAHAELAAALERQAPHHGEYELHHQDGRPFWAAVELMPLAADDGAERQHMLMFTDETKRVTAAHELAASEARFRSALAAMSEGFVLHDAEGAVVQCNESALRILGLTRDELFDPETRGRRLDCVREDGRAIPAGEMPVAFTLRTGQAQRGVTMGLDGPSGRRVWLSMDSAPFVLPGSGRPGVVVTFVDITARRQAEQRVRTLTRVVEESPTFVLLMNADNRIDYVNHAFEERTGYRLQDVRGLSPSFMLSDQTPKELWDGLGRALSEGQHWRGEMRNVARDGSGWISDSQVFALRGPDGAVTHYVALMLDITEQRRREGELAAAREAALAAARTKNEFLRNVSHELRTPLNGIMGMSELLLHTPLNAGQRTDLTQLRRSADEMLTVVTQLFDFVQTESGEPGNRATTFRLRGALGEIERAFADGAESRGLRWSVEVEPGVPDLLVGDPSRLRGVLLRLAENAVKFTEHGAVGLRVRLLAEGDAAATLRFETHDTGIGIPRERQADIFDAFAQVDGSSTRRYGGVGLGLALASRLVRQMGGELQVESEPGKGSTFSFSLELAHPPAAGERPAAPGPAATPLGGAYVLVVTERRPARATTRVALEAAGAQVGCACGPEEAAVVLAPGAAQRPAALVVDQRDGRPGGFDLVATLREAGLALPPTVLITSTGEHGDAERCRAHGIAGYLTAPAGDADLVEALRYVLAGAATDAAPLVTRHLLREDHHRRRVLLVDDNAVNRKVATRLLERAGYDVTAAVDGRDALERFVAGGWDLVLMDVQMPGMDGIEATRRIREHERDGGRARTPILALTAHSLDTDRHTVLAAGMDDLIPKPIQTDVLLGALHRHLAPPAPGAEAPEAPPALDEVIEWDEALERMGGDEDLLHELLRIFHADAGSMLLRLDEAGASGDPLQLERTAHALKGASATISARRVSALAKDLEDLAREGRLEETRGPLGELRREFRRLVRALEAVGRRKAA